MQSSPPRGRSQSHYQTPSTSRSSHSRRRRPSLPRSPASRILADFQPRKDTQLPRPNVNTIPTGKTLRQKPALPTPPSSNSSATDIVQSDLPQWMLPHNRPRSSPSLDVEPAPTKKKIPGDLPDLPVPQFDQIRTCKRRQARLGYQNEMLYWQSKGREVVNGPTRRTLKGDTVEDELIYVSCVWHLRAFRPWHRKYALTEQLRSAIWGEPDESIETIREHYVAMVQHRPRAMTAGQLCLKWPMAFQQDGQPYTKYCKLWGLPHRSQQRADAVERKEPVLRSIEALQRRARTHASVRRTMGREEGTKREASPSDHRILDGTGSLSAVGFYEMDPDTFHSENRRIEETRQLREQVERLTAEMKEMKQKQQQQHAPRSCSRVSADGPVASRTDNQVPAPETMLDLGRATSSASSSESSDENEDDDDEDDTEDGDVDGSEDEVGGSDVAGTEAADTQSGSGSDSEGSDETSDQGLHEASTLPLSSRRQGLVRQPTPFKRPASFSISTTSSSTSDSSSKNQSNSTPSNHDTWDEGYDQPTPSIEDHAAIDAVAMPPPALPAKSSCRDASLPSDYVRQSATPGLFPGLISRAQSRETDPMSGLGSINWAQAGFPTFNGDNPGHDNDCAEQLFGDADNFDDFVQYDTVGGASQRSASIHSFSKTEQHHAQLGNAGRQIPIRSHGKAKARASTNKLVDDYARPAKRQRTRSPAHDPRPLATASSFRQPSVSAVQAFRHVLESRAMSEKPAVRSELANLPGNARFKKQQEPRDMFTDVLEGTWPDLRNSTEYQLAAFVSTVTVASCRDEIPQEKQSLCWQVVQAASACLAAKKSGYR